MPCHAYLVGPCLMGWQCANYLEHEHPTAIGLLESLLYLYIFIYLLYILFEIDLGPMNVM